MDKLKKNNLVENKINFTVIVVCFNPGKKLKYTLDSIYSQEYWNYRVIIKDGNSDDGSLESLQDSGYFIKRYSDCTDIFVGKDNGIYDAMNIALNNLQNNIENNYVIFMNCGDVFYSRQTLGKVADYIEEYLEKRHYPTGYDMEIEQTENDKARPQSDNMYIFYGNQFNRQTNTIVASAPRLNEFGLFRNVPCHQVCFYDSRLFKSRGYDIRYKVRADYEHFLYSIYEERAKAVYLEEVISDYEGGGFSETKKNRELSSVEHREITDKYMGKRASKYRALMTLSGAGIRTAMAESKRFSKVYNKIKSLVYKIKR